jgi:predicted nuclease with TOPRIM domain
VRRVARRCSWIIQGWPAAQTGPPLGAKLWPPGESPRGALARARFGNNINEVIGMADRQKIQDEMSRELEQGQSKVDEIKAKMGEYGAEASEEMHELLAKAEANLAAGRAKFNELAAASDDKFDELWAESKENWNKVAGEMRSGWESLSDKVKGFFS